MILKDTSIHHHQLRISWIQLAISHVGMLSTTFLSTCRHLHEAYQTEEYITLAMQYRILCIRAIRDAIDAGNCSATDSIIATIISLTLDEVSAAHITLDLPHNETNWHDRTDAICIDTSW